MKLRWTQLVPQPDPQAGRPCARSSHGVSVLAGGQRLIVYGGEHVARTPLPPADACWAVDDLERPTWRAIDCSNGPPERIAHAQAVASDGCVYIFGGRAGITMQEQAMNDMWKLDCSGEPGTEVWTEIQPNLSIGDAVPEARSFHKMVAIDNSLYVFGGCGATSGRLADLHRFDLTDHTWHALPVSQLRGRGGPNLIKLASATKLAVVAGFAGEETNDGHVYDLANGCWDATLLSTLSGLRPRSVCVSAAFPSAGVIVIFGGEVDPSDRGHEGAGGFANDVVLLEETTGAYRETIAAPPTDPAWPGPRGWSDAGAVDAPGRAQLFVFGGLAGDDAHPTRLNDLWRLDVEV